jgi:1,4-alpha-glucan branching enzyme
MKKIRKSGAPDRFQVHLFHEGTLHRAYEMLGAHPGEEEGQKGVRFSVWAPHAAAVSVIGDFNGWDGSQAPMEKVEKSGIWTVFVPGVKNGRLYKFELSSLEGEKLHKADPYAFFSELRPCSASRVFELEGYAWKDKEWLEAKEKRSVYQEPLNIYEVHLGSWRQKDDGSFYTYRELADLLVDYAVSMGYTHLQLLPLGEHPFDGSWGYQTTGYYAVTSRYGTPHDFMYFVDRCHQKGLGVILDWVAAHFCRDGHGLARFDGTPLYEACEICGWGTLQFDFARPEVRSFLISNAVFWLEVFHIDGLRVDAVASMLYLDYGKEPGEWMPNVYGGNGNLGAISFLKYLNEVVFANFPQALMIAEESTEWPLVTGPTYSGGLGFNYKWNMGWMNDCLNYMVKDPIYRKWHHNLLTFSFFYAFSENFILPLSHDEVVHGKRSLIDKMPGDYWQKFANFRTFMGYMMAHPGKKLVFMGQEIAQFIEWRYYEGLEWHLLDFAMHRKFQLYIKDLNRLYLRERALWEVDHDWRGFSWIDCHNAEQSILIFSRQGQKRSDFLIAICNFTPCYYESFRIGLPNLFQTYQEVINSDAVIYGGSGRENSDLLKAEEIPWHNYPNSLEIKMPPLAFLLLKPVVQK